MKWSVSLGRIAGIPINVHATFALLLAWIGIVHWTASGSFGAVVSGIVFIVALFAGSAGLFDSGLFDVRAETMRG
jgi:Zn-dependent protease